jgi:cytochrome c
MQPCVNDANTIGVHAPQATVIWDYINRGMPLGREGSLKPDEVYSLTAFLLFRNNVIKEDEVMNEKTLPAVRMPNANGFAVADWKPGTPRLQGYP